MSEPSTDASPAARPAAPPVRAGRGSRAGPLVRQLRWFSRLRWFAGTAVVAGAALDLLWLRHFPNAGAIGAMGAAILVYNAVLWLLLVALTERSAAGRAARARSLRLLAWAQLLLDFAALAVLLVLTGGVRSPLAGLFVLHMVFASLLLPAAMAYAAAGAAIAIVAVALAISGRLPSGEADRFAAAAQALTLPAVVFVTNHLARALRQQRRRLVRQNRRIRRLARQARRQHRLMAQHEKMVALGQMAAGVAHEIANPLASMDGLLQLAQRNPDRPRPELVARLREQVARVDEIIRQMRSFAHPVDGQWQNAEVNAVVEEALGVLRFDKRLRRTTLQRQFATDVGTARMMPQALQQVIVNLVTNAFDATDASAEPTVIVRTLRRDGSVLIEVSDNGHGIRPEHLRHLFEPFFTTKPVGKGTGLGLSISYTLVERQGGHLSVRSERGQGATFTIRLRAGTTAAIETAPGNSPPAGSQNREAPAGPSVISGKSEA